MKKWKVYRNQLERRFLDGLYVGAGKKELLNRESTEYLNSLYILEVIYENTSKFILTGVIAILLGIGNYFVFFSIIYGSLKYFAYGVHFDSTFLCFVIGSITYYGSIYLSLFLSTYKISNMIYFVIYVVCFLVYRLYAPAVSKHQYLRDSRKIKLKRQIQCYIIVIYLSSALLSDVYKNLMLLALVAEATNILPIAFCLIERRGVKSL